MKQADEDSRIPVELGILGAGRGATHSQPLILDFNDRSEILRLDPLLIDPVPGKAQVLAKQGRNLGLVTNHREAEGWHYLTSGAGSEDTSPVVVQVDDPGTVAQILEERNLQQPLFIYIFLDVPGVGVVAVRLLVRPEDHIVKMDLAAFFNSVSDLQARGGTQDVFRSGTPQTAAEDLYDGWFADHLEKNISKSLHNLEFANNPAEATFNGRETSILVILRNDNGWRSPDQLLDDTHRSLTTPVRPGLNFLIAELGPDSIRFHRARYRVTDQKFVLTRRQDPEANTADPVAVLDLLRAAYVAD